MIQDAEDHILRSSQLAQQTFLESTKNTCWVLITSVFMFVFILVQECYHIISAHKTAPENVSNL